MGEIVRGAFHHRDGSVYRLDAFSIMPNQVHGDWQGSYRAPSLEEAGLVS